MFNQLFHDVVSVGARLDSLTRHTDSLTDLRDLSKAINHASANLTLPFPGDLVQVINANLEKHNDPDESVSLRLQDELLYIYQSSILEHPSRLAPLISILRSLKPVIRRGGRLLL